MAAVWRLRVYRGTHTHSKLPQERETELQRARVEALVMASKAAHFAKTPSSRSFINYGSTKRCSIYFDTSVFSLIKAPLVSMDHGCPQLFPFIQMSP